MFNLVEWTKETTRPEGIHRFYYIRSFHFRVSELRQMLLDWSQEDIHHDEALELWALTNDLSDKASIFVRYVGTSCLRTPYERFRDDLTGGCYSILGRFLNTVQKEFPEVLASAKIYEFVDARIQQSTSATASNLSDFRERALISLFDLKTLLNRQAGGLKNIYQPNARYQELWKRLQPFLSDPTRDLVSCHPETAEKIRDWARQRQNFAKNNQQSTGSDKYPLSETYTSALFEQSCPYQHI